MPKEKMYMITEQGDLGGMCEELSEEDANAVRESQNSEKDD